MFSQEKPLRVAVFGQSGPLTGSALRTLLICNAPSVSVELIVEAPGHKRRKQTGLLWGLVQPQGHVDRARAMWDLMLAAKQHGKAYAFCTTGDDARVAHVCRRLHIDVGVAIGLPFRLSTELRSAAHEILNAHPSMLPRWRGASPLFWWLRSGEVQTGISIHVMRHGFDTGPLLAQRPFVPPAFASGEDILAATGEMSGRLLAQVLSRWGRGERVARPQPRVCEQRAPLPRAQDGHITPSRWPARSLARFLAGAPFFVTPSMMLGRERFFVADDAQAVGMREGESALPGDFALVGDRLWMRAQDGLVTCRVQR